MVKIKNRYHLVEAISDNVSDVSLSNRNLYLAFLKIISEFHGDLGVASVKNSLLVKIVDGDVFMVRIETSVAHMFTSVVPFVTHIDSAPVVLRTVFIGRSIRSCENRLIKFRRKELCDLYGSTTTGDERKIVLRAVKSTHGKT